jgi:hypothetical protein
MSPRKPRNYEQRIYKRRMSRLIRTIENDANQNRILWIQIFQIPTPQITTNSFEDNFFNGTSFHDNDGLAGFSTFSLL